MIFPSVGYLLVNIPRGHKTNWFFTKSTVRPTLVILSWTPSRVCIWFSVRSQLGWASSICQSPDISFQRLTTHRSCLVTDIWFPYLVCQRSPPAVQTLLYTSSKLRFFPSQENVISVVLPPRSSSLSPQPGPISVCTSKVQDDGSKPSGVPVPWSVSLRRYGAGCPSRRDGM